MTKIRKLLVRAGTMTGIVSALVLGTSPVQALVTIETVTGVCRYQAGTVEGVAAAVPPGLSVRQTGIVCNVYEGGRHIGGCSGALPSATAACVGPVVGTGPPTVCTYAYAYYGNTLVEDAHCE